MYKVKTQYVQISNIIDTSIKRLISDQSTPMVKSCMYIMFDVVDTAFSYWRVLVICQFLQESSKVKESRLYVIWNAHPAFLLFKLHKEEHLSILGIKLERRKNLNPSSHNTIQLICGLLWDLNEYKMILIT